MLACVFQFAACQQQRASSSKIMEAMLGPDMCFRCGLHDSSSSCSYALSCVCWLAWFSFSACQP
jgi:hypothetical protein